MWISIVIGTLHGSTRCAWLLVRLACMSSTSSTALKASNHDSRLRIEEHSKEIHRVTGCVARMIEDKLCKAIWWF